MLFHSSRNAASTRARASRGSITHLGMTLEGRVWEGTAVNYYVHVPGNSYLETTSRGGWQWTVQEGKKQLWKVIQIVNKLLMSPFEFLPFLPLICQTKVSKTFLWVVKLSGLNHQITQRQGEIKICAFSFREMFAKIHLQIYRTFLWRKVTGKDFSRFFAKFTRCSSKLSDVREI
jgi:hypothetical protein